MKQRRVLIWGGVLIALAIAVVLVRDQLGRTRPDVVAWFSFDDGLLTFSRAYASGRVGPFSIGDTRAQAIERLSSRHVLAQDRAQLRGREPEWIVSLRAASGGYVTYRITFIADRVTSIRASYAVLAGL